MGNTEPCVEHPGSCPIFQRFCQSLVSTENIDTLLEIAEKLNVEVVMMVMNDKKFSLVSLNIYNNFDFFVDTLNLNEIAKKMLLELWEIYIKEGIE